MNNKEFSKIFERFEIYEFDINNTEDVKKLIKLLWDELEDETNWRIKCAKERDTALNDGYRMLGKNKLLQNNWNELKKWLRANDVHFAEAIPFRETLRKMEELEKRSNRVKN